MHYVYVLESKSTGKWYIGYISNLRQRLTEHNAGKNQSTLAKRPWSLIYYEACLEQLDALRREKYLKTTHGRRLLKRRLKDYLYKQRD